MKSKRVVVGLSGGVDSSIAAYLLKKEGYDVIGLFMKNWHNEEVTISNECPWLEDSYDAIMVSQKLGIPFQTVDLSKEYKERIVDYMFDEYSNGRTPNPDILCNKEIKFDLFLNIAISLGADFIATGHYCQKHIKKIKNKTVFQLIEGADSNKDQSYFLCQLNQYQLQKSLFPIGHLKKDEVRKIAKAQGLVTAEKKDSQGLCFVGKVKLPEFLKQKLSPVQGDIIQIPNDSNKYTFRNSSKSNENISIPLSYCKNDGKKVGTHQGAHFYTIGQRKGLFVGGTKKPLFVISTDIKSNIIYVGEGSSHPGLFRKSLRVSLDKVHWIREDLILSEGQSISVSARIRYRQPLFSANILQKKDYLYVYFDKEQSAVTPGQFIAWYINNELVGSGVILG
tara:strand:+ start:6855 stop:8036 length:1182 start_codon:yes stop_codon:yes gene_type:complete